MIKHSIISILMYNHVLYCFITFKDQGNPLLQRYALIKIRYDSKVNQ